MNEKTVAPGGSGAVAGDGSAVWRTPHIVGLAVAFFLGSAVGLYGGRSRLPATAAPGTDSAPHAVPVPPPPSDLPDGVSADAAAGLAALQDGRYAEAEEALARAGMAPNAPPALYVFHAVAKEGAGDAAGAESLIGNDPTRLALLREIGREAFLEHQDITIAGPAYRLYLRFAPDTEPNRGMMRQAVSLWEETRK